MVMNIEKLVEEIKKVTGGKTEIIVQPVQKGNVILTGIIIGNSTIRPTVYVEYYVDMFTGNNYETVARKMVLDVYSAMQENQFPNEKILLEWDYAQNHLLLCISPKGSNEGFVTYPYLDLELYVRVVIDESCRAGRKFMKSYKVSEDIMKTWGISRETLLHMAFDSTKTTYQMTPLSKITGIPESFPMMQVTNKYKNYGASVMYHKKFLKNIADEWNCDLFLLPSSVDEICIMPVLSADTKSMSRIVRIGNGFTDPEEVLSNHVYIFHRDTEEITY